MTSNQTERQEATKTLTVGKQLFEQQNYAHAVPALREAADRISKAFSPNHPEIIGCYELLGKANFELGNANEAQMYYEKAMGLLKEAPEQDWARILQLQFDVIACHKRMNRLNKAEVLFSQLEDLASRHLATDHPLSEQIFGASKTFANESSTLRREAKLKEAKAEAKAATKRFLTKGDVDKPAPLSNLLDSIEGTSENAQGAPVQDAQSDGKAAGEDQHKLRSVDQESIHVPISVRLKESAPSLFGQWKHTMPLLIGVFGLLSFVAAFKYANLPTNPFNTIPEQTYYGGSYPLQLDFRAGTLSFMRSMPASREKDASEPSALSDPHKAQSAIRTVPYVPISNWFALLQGAFARNVYWLICQPNGTLVDENGNEFISAQDDRFPAMESMQNFALTALRYHFQHGYFPDRCKMGNEKTEPHIEPGVLYTAAENPYTRNVDPPSIKTVHNLVISNVTPEDQEKVLLEGRLWNDKELAPGKIDCLRFFPKSGGEIFIIHTIGKDGKLLSSNSAPMLFGFEGELLVKPTDTCPMPADKTLAIIASHPRNVILNFALLFLTSPAILIILFVVLKVRQIRKKHQKSA
jgi:tetratricopeptide (TPR) repeat protein